MSVKSILAIYIMSLSMFLLTVQAAEAQTLDLRADADNTSTMQTLSINRTNVSFDTQLGATGVASVVWRATIQGNPSGATFTVKRSALGGTAPDSLLAVTRLTAEDASGANPFTPNAKFASGVALGDISTTDDTLGTAAGNGVCRFQLKLSVNGQSKIGSGTVSTTLFIVGALNP